MLTQAVADALIGMKKTFLNNAVISLTAGSDLSYELEASAANERFLLDLSRGTIRLSKFKFQTRARTAIVLVRLDLDGSPHTNPDGTRIGGTHLHVYREGYDDKWAYPLDPHIFDNPSEIETTFKHFCIYCNIVGLPNFQKDLL